MASLQADLTATLAVQRLGTTVNLLAFSKTFSDEEHDEAQQHYEEVANGAVDQVINLGPLTTVEILALSSDQSITLKINGSVTAVGVKGLLVWGGNITALTVSNASGSQANIEMAMVGT